MLLRLFVPHYPGADPGFCLEVKGTPASEAESCQCSEAELCKQSEPFARGVQGWLKDTGNFGFLMLKYMYSSTF